MNINRALHFTSSITNKLFHTYVYELNPSGPAWHIICVYLAFRMMLLVMKCLSPLPCALRSMTQLLSASPYMVWTGDPASQPGSIVLSSPDLSNCHSGLVTDNWQYGEKRAHNNIQIHIVSLQISPRDHIKREHCVKYRVPAALSLVRQEMPVHISMQDTIQSLYKIFHNYLIYNGGIFPAPYTKTKI